MGTPAVPTVETLLEWTPRVGGQASDSQSEVGSQIQASSIGCHPIPAPTKAPTKASARSAGSSGTTLREWGNESASTFHCSKCLQNRPISMLRVRSGQKVCEDDVRSYTSLQARWTTNRQLRVWWKTLPDDQKVTWYIKQQGAEFGRKRTVEEMMYSEFEEETAKASRMELDDLIPWRIYRRRAIADGTSSAQAAYDFVALIQNNQVACEFIRGEWHVPEYQGVRREAGSEHRAGTSVNRNAKVNSAEQLQQLTCGGRALVEKQANAYAAASNQGGSHCARTRPL